MEELSLSFESFTLPVFPAEEPLPPAAESLPLEEAAPPPMETVPPLAETAPPELPLGEVAEAVEASGWEDPVPGAAAAGTAAAAGIPEGAGSGPPAASSAAFGQPDYLALVMRRLEEKKIYPLAVRKRGIEGDVTLDFTIGRNGEVDGVALAASDHRFLAQAAVETVRSASPFPALSGMNRQEYPVRVTIRYRLEEE
jgi:protein TonB